MSWWRFESYSSAKAVLFPWRRVSLEDFPRHQECQVWRIMSRQQGYSRFIKKSFIECVCLLVLDYKLPGNSFRAGPSQYLLSQWERPSSCPAAETPFRWRKAQEECILLPIQCCQQCGRLPLQLIHSRPFSPAERIQARRNYGKKPALGKPSAGLFFYEGQLARLAHQAGIICFVVMGEFEMDCGNQPALLWLHTALDISIMGLEKYRGLTTSKKLSPFLPYDMTKIVCLLIP